MRPHIANVSWSNTPSLANALQVRKRENVPLFESLSSNYKHVFYTPLRFELITFIFLSKVKVSLQFMLIVAFGINGYPVTLVQFSTMYLAALKCLLSDN